MKLSTRSRYGVRLLFELALNYKNGNMLLKEISEKQDISEKYLSNIIILLKAKNYVNSSRGAYGGYILAKKPKEINIYEVVNLLEGSLTIMDCLVNKESCDFYNNCPTNGMWNNINNVIKDYLKNITLKNLVENYKLRINKEPSMYYI